MGAGGTTMKPKLVAYYRVSTRKQGESGLGLDGQKAAVAAHAAAHGATIVAEFTEVESGKRTDRPQLARALAHVRLSGATLCIAKLDRLARNVAFLSGLMEGMKGGRKKMTFVCCDNPHATPLTIHILAAVAEDEAQRISARTKAALAAYKAGKRVSRRVRAQYPDGVPAEVEEATAGKLGGALPQCRNLTDAARCQGQAHGTRANVARAAEHAASLGTEAREKRAAGWTLRAIAESFNAQDYQTRRGLPWTPTAVLRLLNRAG